MKYRLSKGDLVLNRIILAALAVVALVVFFPFYNVLIISVARYKDIAGNVTYLFPKALDLTTYSYILQEKSFLNAFGVSVFVTAVGTLWNMFLSTSAAYALSKKNMPGRKFLLAAMIFTMYFNGGLIPYYLVVKQMHLVNSLFSMIIPVSINTYYMIIMKNYFCSLDPSLEESARIDGANPLYTLLKIIIPISAPFMATFTLFYGVERWNEWFNALLFISDANKQPLQIFLRQLLIVFSNNLSSMAQTMSQSRRPLYQQSLQMAAVVVATVPIMLVYPYLQKYFVKGIMIGAIKD
jgi:putative aldouronate transport system permease protein